MGYKSDPFPIRRGVLQGCILSLILFEFGMERTPQHGWQIVPGWLLDELSYADDIAMIDVLQRRREFRLDFKSSVIK